MIEGRRIAQNFHILVFFCGFWREKDDLHVQKDDFEAVFFLFEFSSGHR
jgi:hypothetical protein